MSETTAKIKIKADYSEADKDSDRFVSRLEKRLKELNSQTGGAKSALPFGIDAKTIQQVQKFAEQLKQINTIKPKVKIDVEMQKAQADIKRFAETSKKLERDLTRQVEKEAEAQYQARTKQWMRGLQEFEKVLNKQNSAVKESSSLFSSFFGASFFGNLAGNLVTNFVSSLSQLPEKVRQVWDEAIKISSERQNALAGLDSISTFKGISSNEAKNAIQNLRLVKAGILDLADASTGLKNLLASGFDLKQSIDILERFSDSAAYGKQSALSFGEAISRAAEGIKNQNSNLVDNVGLTKNLSAILKERGFELEDLSNKQKSQNALLALYKGIMEETTAQVGDADKITNSYTGSTAALDAAYTNLLKTFGDYTTQSQDIILANRIMTEQINGYTKSVGDANSETGQFVRDAVKNYAYLKAQIIPFLDFAANSVKLVVNELALFATGALGVVAKVAEAIPNLIIDAVNKVKGVIAQIPSGILPPELQALANLPDLQKLTTGDILLTQYEGFLKNVEINLKGINKALEEGARVNSLFNNQRPNNSSATGSLVTPNKSNLSGGNSSDTKGGRSRLADAGLDEYATNRQKALYNQALSNLPSQLKQQIEEASNQYKIPLKLALAQIFSESSFNPNAKSPFNKNVGDYAYGLTQQLPATASKVLKRKVIGKELQKNTGLALSAWGEYMNYLFDRYGDWELATLAYHQGEGTVDKLVKILDKGKSADGFFKARPKGKAYVSKIAALSGIRGDEQFKRGEPTLPNLVATQSAEINKDLISVRELDAQSKFILGLYEAQNIKERSQTLNDRQLNFESEINAKIEDYNLSLKEQMQDLMVELEFLKARDRYAEAQVEYQKQYNAQIREIGDIERDLLVLKAQNLDKEFIQQRRLLASKREEFDLQRDITNLQDQLANQGVNDSLKIQAAHLRDILDLRGRELDAVISINRSQLELNQAMTISNDQIRAGVYDHLAQQQTLNQAIASGINQTYDAVVKKVNSSLDTLNEKTKGYLSFLIEPLKAMQTNNVSKLFSGIVDKLFPGFSQITQSQTENPIAKPIVTEQQTTNSLLKDIKNILSKSISFGGGGGTGGTGGTGAFNSIADIINFARGGGSGSLSTSGTLATTIGLRGGETYTAGQGGILSKLKGMFGKEGSVWGEQGFGNNVGTYSAIGGFAQLAGGLIGGKWGGVIGGAGSGLATGAQIGSMIFPGIGTAVGAAIGAITGGLFGWLKGRKLEKKDKNENIPALQKGFTDALAQFRELINHPTDNALEQANQIRAQIAGGFGVQFQTKKYTKEAQKQIQAQLAEIDRVPGGLMEQLKASLQRVREAQEFSNRFVATFAGGVYMDGGFAAQYGDFKRRNGMMSGAWTGKDHIPALIANREMVLNPMQQMQVIKNAGFDPFEGAGIPNYRSGKPKRMAEGGYIGTTPNFSNSSSPTVNNFKIVLEGVIALPDSKAYLESPDGKRQVVEIIGDSIDSSTGQTGIPRKIKQAESRT